MQNVLRSTSLPTIMCSVKCASPGVSSGSEKWPARTTIAAAARSASGSCTSSARSPLLSVTSRKARVSIGGDRMVLTRSTTDTEPTWRALVEDSAHERHAPRKRGARERESMAHTGTIPLLAICGATGTRATF